MNIRFKTKINKKIHKIAIINLKINNNKLLKKNPNKN